MLCWPSSLNRDQIVHLFLQIHLAILSYSVPQVSLSQLFRQQLLILINVFTVGSIWLVLFMCQSIIPLLMDVVWTSMFKYVLWEWVKKMLIKMMLFPWNYKKIGSSLDIIVMISYSVGAFCFPKQSLCYRICNWG